MKSYHNLIDCLNKNELPEIYTNVYELMENVNLSTSDFFNLLQVQGAMMINKKDINKVTLYFNNIILSQDKSNYPFWVVFHELGHFAGLKLNKPWMIGNKNKINYEETVADLVASILMEKFNLIDQTCLKLHDEYLISFEVNDFEWQKAKIDAKERSELILNNFLNIEKIKKTA